MPIVTANIVVVRVEVFSSVDDWLAFWSIGERAERIPDVRCRRDIIDGYAIIVRDSIVSCVDRQRLYLDGWGEVASLVE